MTSLLCSDVAVLDSFLCSLKEAAAVKAAVTAATKSLFCSLLMVMDSLANGSDLFIKGSCTAGDFPLNELHPSKKPDLENKDASETEDDDDEDNDDAVDDLDGDEGNEEDGSGEDGDDDDDPEDEPEANGDGGSDDGDEDDDEEEDDEEDDEDGDKGEEEEEDEDEDEETPQPPTKKRK